MLQRQCARRTTFAAAVAAALVTGVPSAFAHETGVITLSAKQLPAGSELIIRGAKLSKGGSVRLELRGALKTFSFGRVRTDTAGAFEQRVTIPADAKPGEYKVVAVAPDGDVTARAELVVTAASAPTSAPAAGTHDMAGMHDMPGMAGGAPHATAEAMKVPVSTTPGSWVVIIATIIASGAGGMALLRGRQADG